MKISELKTNKLLPNYIKNSEIINICIKELGMPTGITKNTELTEDQISRILVSPRILTFVTKAEVSAKHRAVVEKYEELEKKYNDLLTKISAMPEFKDTVNVIKTIISNIAVEKKEYIAAVKKFRINNLSNYFDFDKSSNMFYSSINSVSSEMSKIVKDDIKSNDKKLEDLNNKLKVKNKFKPSSTGRKLANYLATKKLELRIKRLSEKKGILHNRQHRIINSYTNMYVNKTNKKFEKYENQLADFEYDISRKMEYLEDFKKVEEEIIEATDERDAAKKEYDASKGFKKISPAYRRIKSIKEIFKNNIKKDFMEIKRKRITDLVKKSQKLASQNFAR